MLRGSPVAGVAAFASVHPEQQEAFDLPPARDRELDVLQLHVRAYLRLRLALALARWSGVAWYARVHALHRHHPREVTRRLSPDRGCPRLQWVGRCFCLCS